MAFCNNPGKMTDLMPEQTKKKKEWGNMEMKKLGFGGMRMPLLNPEDVTSVDLDQVCRMVDAFMEQGFTYFDTAYMYHKYVSECVLKKALVERYPRERFVLADKLPLSHLKEDSILEAFFTEQLEKCGLEYFDYYLLHNVSRSSYQTAERHDAFAFINQKKAEGKVRRTGFSFHADADLLEEILEKHSGEVEFVQLQLNYLDWENEYIQSRRCYEVCRRYGKDVIVMEPVKGGLLANVPDEVEQMMKVEQPDMSAASWAIRFAAGLEGVIMVLSGMSNMEQLMDNTSYMKEFKALDEAEMAVIGKAIDIIQAGTKVACTKCRYCVEGCPKQIAIPEYFALYNSQMLFGGKSNADGYYGNYLDKHGRAGDCIGCGACEQICPQHLPIPELLKDVSAVFDK